MTQAKQRSDLLEQELLIPVMNTDGKTRYTQLKTWVEVYFETDDGVVSTPAGVFDSIDLEYREA